MSNGAHASTSPSNDEADVLASVAATLQNQDVYEDMVLREASHALAPSLVLLSEEGSPRVAGFPSLASLAPSNPPIDVLYKVLSNVRKQQKSKETDEISNMQEQMILSLLAGRVDDVPVRRDEAEWERKRSECYSKMENNSVPTSDQGIGGSSGGVDVAVKQRRRIPMMKRKEQPSDRNELEVEDIQKDKQELRRLREQRQKRRNERLGKRRRTVEPTNEEEEESDEAELDLEESTTNKQKDDIDDIGTSSDANGEFENESVKCPVCQEALLISDENDKDTQLARHMNICQRVRRSSRRQPAGMDSQPQRPSAVKATRKRQRETVVTPIISRSIDDYEEDFYTDRVDDWIESGLSMMKEMKERDVSDVQPGEKTFAGGLYIPAWINNRLFGYQRESLEWMWELHQQQVGGIIGDEMGLVSLSG